ncbi:MAG: AAA family ATPase [Candidatus Delongbacteria bacterium]|jgi:AAA15 family ATPase/GTPase|nr:AAA family ATPase [Candidatus Delongbacteria bacterium]MDY0016758.1 AAA family ATPase [Candidatus Delongbacteria bacterium]
MLISVKIENFRSIKQPLNLDFNCANKISKKDLPDNIFEINKSNLVKSIIFYGRNASGKSNIILALQALSFLVNESDKYKHGERIEPFEPYLFETEMQGKPIKIEVDFYGIKSKIKYKYSIAFDSNEISEESLNFYPQGVITKLYERRQSKITYGEQYRGVKNPIESNLLSNQLFLSKSASMKVMYLDEVYLSLTKHFHIDTRNDEMTGSAVIRFYSEIAMKENFFKKNIIKLLQAADTNIIDFDSIETIGAEVKFKKNVPKKVMNEIKNQTFFETNTKHKMFEGGREKGFASLDIYDESLGTQKLFAIGCMIIDTLSDGGVIVIDELDKGLHPLLTRMLIKLFHSKKNNPKNAQLIFATHDGTLMDLDLFRRDQICFIEKEYEGYTTITKLSDYTGVRKGIPLEKWYMSGRFKGIPVINDVELEF